MIVTINARLQVHEALLDMNLQQWEVDMREVRDNALSPAHRARSLNHAGDLRRAVARLRANPPGLLWCDECHYWHDTAADCAYYPEAGA
jgi:hypothetical protein